MKLTQWFKGREGHREESGLVIKSTFSYENILLNDFIS